MPLPSDTIGGVDDGVSLELNGHTISIVKSYDVKSGIFTQPCAFSIVLGWSDLVQVLLQSYRPNDRFALKIAGNTQFVGALDALDVTGDGNGSQLTIRGRDDLALIHDSDVESDKTYDNLTPTDLVAESLKTLGILQYTINTSFDRSRRNRAGVAIVTLPSSELPKPPGKSKARQRHAGESWYHCIQREIQHAGEFLWADPSGDFTYCVTRPNPQQLPIARVYRLDSGVKNVESWELKNDTTSRAASYQVLGKSGGPRSGPGIVGGIITDEEMTGWGFKKLKVVRDRDISSNEEGSFYASRKLAESRRAGYSLTYTVTGHTLPSLDGRSRVTITPDTMIQVDDDELGIHRPMWIENCDYTQTLQGTRTKMTLLRGEDMVFGDASP